MKRVTLIMLPVLFLFSCMKNNSLPRVETITKGSKWNLEIGSSPTEIYSQLQLLGKEKLFNNVAIVSGLFFCIFTNHRLEIVCALLCYNQQLNVQHTIKIKR